MGRGFIFTLAVCAGSCAWPALSPRIVAWAGVWGAAGDAAGWGEDERDRQNASPDYYRGKAPPPETPSTPHGGEFLQTDTSRYEIVYLPLQARIYLFDHELKPVSARDLHVRMSLKLPPQNTPQQVPFQYVALPAGTAEQDYVVAAFDFRQLPEKDTPITFEFSGLPDRQKFLGIWDRHEGTASFTPMFAPAKIRPYVARVLLTEADRDGVLRQTFCPVSRRDAWHYGPGRQALHRRLPLVLGRGRLRCGGP